MISSKQLGDALYQLIKEGTHSADVVTDAFLEYVTSHKLESLMPRVIEYVEYSARKDAEFTTLDITSGLLVDNEVTGQIRVLLNAPTDAYTATHIEPELIGGFVATYKGFLYDASLKTQLQRLQAQLITH